MQKREDQVMNAWISDVKNAVFRLKSSGVAIDENIILTLTAGLPESYLTFIVALDSLPTDQLTLPNVVTRLLNEEVRQNHSIQSSLEHNEALAGCSTSQEQQKEDFPF